MKEITNEAYFDALEIVKGYHKQILGNDVGISKAHQEIEEKMLMNSKAGLLLDFFEDHLIPRRVFSSIIGSFPQNYPLFDSTVDHFLLIYLMKVQHYRDLGWMRGVSANTMTEFLIILSQNGYQEQVKPFEQYYVKK